MTNTSENYEQIWRSNIGIQETSTIDPFTVRQATRVGNRSDKSFEGSLSPSEVCKQANKQISGHHHCHGHHFHWKELESLGRDFWFVSPSRQYFLCHPAGNIFTRQQIRLIGCYLVLKTFFLQIWGTCLGVPPFNVRIPQKGFWHCRSSLATNVLSQRWNIGISDELPHLICIWIL